VATVARFAFVANTVSGSAAGGGELSAFTVSASTGLLRHNGYAAVASGGGLTSVAVDPAGKLVYATNASGVWGYSINAANGTLSSVGSVVPAQTTPAAVTIDPSGKFLYVANQGSNSVSGFKIDATSGVLTQIVGPPPSPYSSGGTGPVGISVAPSGGFVYVVNSGGLGAVVAFAIDTGTGALSQRGGALSAGTTPVAIGVDPTGRFVYVANAGSANVSGFKINPDGTLMSFTSAAVATGNTPRSISFDAAGKFLYVANQTTADVSVFSIDASSGVLTPPPLRIPTGGTGTSAVGIDPSNRFAYAVNQSSNDITVFGVTGGSLAPLGIVAGRFSPGSIAITKGSSPVTYTPRFAYTTNLSSSNVSAFRIDAGSGALSAAGSPILTGGTSPFPIAANPAGTFLYVGNEATSDISAFRIDAATGALSGMNATTGVPSTVAVPIPAGGTNPDGLTVDPSGRFLYTGNVNAAPNSVSTFTIDATSGALTMVGSPVTSVGSQPFSPAVDPSGRFLYTANLVSANVSAFRIDALTGALTPVTGQPFAASTATAPFSLVVSPSGKVVYVAFRNNEPLGDLGSVAVFSIAPADGSLTQVGTLVQTGKGPRSITMDAAGKFVYVANEDLSNISAYKVDPASGGLTELTTSPFPSTPGAQRMSITADPSGKFAYVGNNALNSVTAFKISAGTGDLGSIGIPTPTAGTSIFGITTTGTIQ
jgi:6-phosphogluconolactonase (cycloisomerase 2 family)